MSKKTETKAASTQLPAYRIYSVTKDDSGNALWAEIGSAFLHRKDGKGLSLYFKARPLEGAQIVLREPKPKKEAA